MKREIRAIGWAMLRLRDIAAMRGIKDEHGRVLHEGYPDPGEVREEMRRVYWAGVKAGKRKAGAK